MKRALFFAAAFSSSACGLILGIDTDLGAPPDAAPDVTIPDTAPEPPEASVDADIDVDAAHAAPRPPAGTYQYRLIGGREDITGPFTKHTIYDSPTSVDIVYDGPSCFFMKLHMRPGYEDDYRFCPSGQDMLLDRYTRSVLRPSAPNSFTLETSYTCGPDAKFFTTSTPPDDRPYDCNGNRTGGSDNDKFRVAGTYHHDPDGTVGVGNENVEVQRFTDTQTVTLEKDGKGVGNATTSFAFSKKTGQIVQLQRRIHSVYGFDFTNYDETEVNISLMPPELDAGADADADAN